MSPQPTSDAKPNVILEIFGRSKAVIGVVHCHAFPGSPNFRGGPVEPIYDAALRDAEAYVSGGVHGLIVENH